MTLGFSFLYALSDEWHQGFVPGRVPSWRDVALDTLGAGVMSGLQKHWGTHLFNKARPFLKWGKAFFLVLFFFSAMGCQPARFWRAARLEKKGKPEEALSLFLRLAEKAPRSDFAAAALLRSARIVHETLGDEVAARQILERLLQEHAKNEKWKNRGEAALFQTPDYFPLKPGSQWEEGDSESGGKNARVLVRCEADPGHPDAARVSRQYFAGKRLLKDLSQDLQYRRVGLELHEYGMDQNTPAVVLKYPFETGARWRMQRNREKFLCTVEGRQTVRVRAGEFKNCLKVRVAREGLGSWRVDYYAPGVGKILTSLATPSSEQRNTELLSFTLGDVVK